MISYTLISIGLEILKNVNKRVTVHVKGMRLLSKLKSSTTVAFFW